jgi:histidyl-tRNA synthetase
VAQPAYKGKIFNAIENSTEQVKMNRYRKKAYTNRMSRKKRMFQQEKPQNGRMRETVIGRYSGEELTAQGRRE